MLTEVTASGTLLREDGLTMAKGVMLTMMIGQEPHGLGDIKGTLMVHDDPEFARRHAGKRLVFVSMFNPEEKVEVFVVGADGACLAFPVPK
jgi:hypothetical protein